MPLTDRTTAKNKWNRRKLAQPQKGNQCRRLTSHNSRKLHRQLARARDASTHEISSTLADLVQEALWVKFMTSRANETAAGPGINVQAKSGLTHAMLVCKTGKRLKAPAAYVLQIDCGCRHMVRQIRFSKPRNDCVECGFVANANLNVAFNFLDLSEVPLQACTLVLGTGSARRGALPIRLMRDGKSASASREQDRWRQAPFC